MWQICNHRELYSKSDLETLSSARARRVKFRKSRAFAELPSVRCRRRVATAVSSSARSDSGLSLPLPRRPASVPQPTTHSSRIYAITAPFSTLYVAGAHCPQPPPLWSFLLFFLNSVLFRSP